MRYFLLFLLLHQAGFSLGQSVRQKIESAFSTFESDPSLKYASNSLTVLNAETGAVIFAKNENVGLASASTLKTISSATAFHILGKDFTWETSIGYSGTLSANGTLNGDLIITGGGDPVLGSDRYDETRSEVILKKWTDAIIRAGIKQISGRVIGDDRLFGTETLPGGWTWQDMGNYYGAGPSSLSWRENQFDLVFKPGRVGEPAELIRTEPEMNYLKIVNEVLTGAPGTGDNVYAYSAPYSDIVYLRGTYGIDLRKAISASVPDPAFDLAYHLSKKLKSAGIQISGGPATARSLSLVNDSFLPQAKIIDIHTSPSLDRVVYWFNQKSVNLFGEHLIKTIALKQAKETSTSKAVELLKKFWEQKIGIDPNALNIYDGSGLSPANRITTKSMALILQSVKTEPWFSSFYESLPLYNNMKIKSGSISDVLAYTGYHTNTSGTAFVFSFIVNNYSGSSSALRQKMFKVLNTLK